MYYIVMCNIIIIWIIFVVYLIMICNGQYYSACGLINKSFLVICSSTTIHTCDELRIVIIIISKFGVQ